MLFCGHVCARSVNDFQGFLHPASCSLTFLGQQGSQQLGDREPGQLGKHSSRRALKRTAGAVEGGPHHLFHTAWSLPAPLGARPIPATEPTSWNVLAAHRAPPSTVEDARGVSGREGEI